MTQDYWILVLVLLAGIALIALSVRRVPEGWRYTVERYGRYVRTLEPGLRVLLPGAERIGARQQVSERLLTPEPFTVTTVDLVAITVRAGVCIQVIDAAKASYEVHDMAATATELLRSSLTGVVGAMTMDQALLARDDLGTQVIDDLDASCSAWGVQVTRVDISALEPPASLVQARTDALAAEQDKLAAVARAEQQQLVAAAEAEQARAVAVAEAEQGRAVAEASAEQSRVVAASAAEQARQVAAAEAEQGRAVAVATAEQERDVEAAQAQRARDVAIAEAEQQRQTSRIAAEQEREEAEHSVAQQYVVAKREAEEARDLAVMQGEVERVKVVAAAEAERQRVDLLARATERRAEADARAMVMVAQAIREGGAQAASFQLAREYIDALRAGLAQGSSQVPVDGGPVASLLSVAPLQQAAEAEAAAVAAEPKDAGTAQPSAQPSGQPGAGVHELNTG